MENFFSILLLSLVIVINSKYVQAIENHVETEGGIQFSGEWVPIDTPDPAPPIGIEDGPKHKEELPQTNTVIIESFYWLGIIIVMVCLISGTKINKLKVLTLNDIRKKENI